MEMTTDEAIEAAAKDLPNGYTIEIFVEQGAAWVRLEKPNGEGTSVDCGKASLAEQIQEATRKAIELEKEPAD